MAEIDINKRIAEEQAKIEVPSYQDVAWDGAWKRRTASLWALGALGLVAGAAIGVGAAFSAVAGGAALTGALIGKSAAIFSAIGISSGMAAAIATGPSAGAAASTAKELERRMLARDIDQAIRADPEATVVLGEDVQPERPFPNDLSGYVNIKTGLLFAAIGAVGGAIMAAAFIASGGLVNPASAGAFVMPAVTTLLGASPSAGAVIAYSIGMGATFGAFFGTNVPRMSRQLIAIAGDLLSGKAIGADWPPAANLPDLKPILSPIIKHSQPEVAVFEEKPVAAKSFAAKEKPPVNYEALVDASMKEAEAAMAR